MPDLLAVLAEPNRRRLLGLLGEGEQSVNELAAKFRVSRPAISQHLGVLNAAGLVTVRQEGRHRYYSLDPAGLRTLRTALEMFWTDELDRLATARPATKGGSVPIEKSVLVPLGADETFALLTEPERLRRWQAVTARVDLRAGGEYRWTIVPGHTASGTFVEVEPGKRLVFTWGWEGSEDLPPAASTVTITLEPADGGTTVHLVHEGLSDEAGAAHLEGWSHYWERLARAGEAGDAGPDEWAVRDNHDLDVLWAAEASAAICQRALRDLGPENRELATPCAKFTVHELVEHLLGSLVHLGGAAGGAMDVAESGTAEGRVADAAQQALEAFRRRGVEGAVTLGERELPAEMAAGIVSIELLVHGWDVAAATSRPVEVPDALAGFVLERARGIIRPEIRDGDRFGPELETGPDATNLDRLVAFTGRRL